jgi:hypothetical protein
MENMPEWMKRMFHVGLGTGADEGNKKNFSPGLKKNVVY